MKGKKLLFAVNLILIASLVLSPMAVFAQSEEPNAPPAETIAESVPAEDTGGDPAVVLNGGEAVENAPAPAPVEDSTGGETTVVTDESVTEEVKEEPQTIETVDEHVTEEKTEAEQPAVNNEEVQKSEDTVTDPETNTEETNTEDRKSVV